jgi:alkylhydroperoxidase family enzyme
VLGFLEAVVREPGKVSPELARAAIAAGVSREALADALHVAYLFGIYDRLADALGWDVPADGSGFYEAGARQLLARGYSRS